MTETISTHVHVKADRATTFDHLTTFENYPEFVRSVRHVRRDPQREQRVEFDWIAAGTQRTYRVDIDLDRSNMALYWRGLDDPDHAGTIAINTVNAKRSDLLVKVELQPSGVVDRVGSATGVVRNRIEHHLRQFAAYVEEQTGRRPSPDAEGHRAPSEKLFDAVFPTDEPSQSR